MTANRFILLVILFVCFFNDFRCEIVRLKNNSRTVNCFQEYCDSTCSHCNSTNTVNSTKLPENVTENGQLTSNVEPFFSESQFKEAVECYPGDTNNSNTRYEILMSFLNKSVIKTKREASMFIAYTLYQTRGYYSKGCVWKNCDTNNNTDDTENFNFGRGYMHLYGVGNYKRASYDIFGDDTLLKNPHIVATNETVAWLTAIWFWTSFVHPVAVTGKFGYTINMIFGDNTCFNSQRQGTANRLFGLYKCVLKIIDVNETANKEGCQLLNNFGESVDKVKDPTENKNIVYIIIGVCVFIFLIIVGVIVYYFMKKRKPVDPKMAFFNAFHVSEKNLEDMGYKEKFEFPVDRLVFQEELGNGFFGSVMKAKAIGILGKEEFTTVAVKKVKDTFDNQQRNSLLAELKISLTLGRHLNIVNFLGAVTTGELMIILEFCKFGNLRDYLLTSRNSFLDQLNTETLEYDKSIKPIMDENDNPLLKTKDLICYAYQISQGMEYIYSKNILHRDLAARNVLLAENNVVKLCDFGLSKAVYHYGDYCTTSSKILPMKWMSIEAIKDRVFTIKNDIWAYGVVLWEIFSLGGDPYPGIPVDEHFIDKLTSGYRMSRPDYCPLTVAKLMNSCWAKDPNDRLNFDALTASLRNILEESTREYYLQLGSSYVNFSKTDDKTVS